MRDAGCHIWMPLPGSAERILHLATSMDLRGPRIFDLQIAAVAREHGATEIWTHDAGFVALPGLKVVDPISSSLLRATILWGGASRLRRCTHGRRTRSRTAAAEFKLRSLDQSAADADTAAARRWASTQLKPRPNRRRLSTRSSTCYRMHASSVVTGSDGACLSRCAPQRSSPREHLIGVPWQVVRVVPQRSGWLPWSRHRQGSLWQTSATRYVVTNQQERSGDAEERTCVGPRVGTSTAHAALNQSRTTNRPHRDHVASILDLVDEQT